MLYQIKEITLPKYQHVVRLDWNNQSIPWWNECCAMVLEVFGLPGDRFIYHPYEDFMEFHFKSEKDWQLCRILLSEKIV